MNGALALAPGARLGPYQLVSELGRGAIGEAFAARVLEGPRAGELLCLKILGRQYHALDAAMRSMAVKSLLHEGRVISQLDHPNIARLLDFGAVGDVWYLALELVEGANLHQLLYRGPLGALHVMRVGFQISKALACAHAHAVVHRDIKPPNVLVGNQGEVKLVDFGLAKVDFASAEFTRHVGTPRYWAPEQLQGEALTPATDIYALGLVLFEALVGAHPFLVPNEREFRQNVLEGRQILSLKDRGFPDDLVAIIERCIATAPGDRFADGTTLAAAFARAIDSHSLASTLAFVQPLAEEGAAGRNAVAVEPLSEEHVYDPDAKTRLGSLANRVADVRDETGDLKTRVFDDPHRRATTAVDAAELAAQAAAMMGYDEAALAKDLSRMARQAREERGAAGGAADGGAISAPRPIEHATKHERRRSRPAQPTTEEFLRRPFTTEMQMMPELERLQPRSAAPEPEKPPATPSAAVRAETEEVTQRPRPSPKITAVVAVLVLGVGVALVVLKEIEPSRYRSNASAGASPDGTSAGPTTMPVAVPAAAPVVALQEQPGRQGQQEQEQEQQQGKEQREEQQDVPEQDAVRQEPATRAPKRRQVPVERVEVTIGLLPYGEVTVDGKALGQSPVKTTLTAGPHRVVARLGQVQRIKTITVSPQDTRFVIRLNDE